MTPRVILIGGSSHTGKTTAARRLASRPGWTWATTDLLARHPGRPWPQGERPVPPHVAEHYRELPTEALIASVQAHYERLWPQIEALVAAHADDPARERLVLEGSALWPSRVAGLRRADVAAVWLTADDDLFAARIRAESGFGAADAPGQALIASFLARTQRFDELLREELARLGLPCVRVRDGDDPGTIEAACLAAMRPLA